MSDVINMINNYGGKASYYHYEGKPLVSTFEGPANSDDWLVIKQSTRCFFVPDWSSLGAKPAVELGTADGSVQLGRSAMGRSRNEHLCRRLVHGIP